jgi:hypothetical protein
VFHKKCEVTVEGYSTNRKETLEREKIAVSYVSVSCILGPKPYVVTSRRNSVNGEILCWFHTSCRVLGLNFYLTDSSFKTQTCARVT